MKNYDSNRVINGTYGEIWIDDDYYAELEEAKAEDTLTYSDVSRVGNLRTGKKLTKIEGKITTKGHHVRSNLSKKINDKVSQGKTPSVKIIISLEDPDAFGAERAAFYGCKPSKNTFFDFKSGSLGEESYDWTYEDMEFLDYIDA